jgi:hypothetical protein
MISFTVLVERRIFTAQRAKDILCYGVSLSPGEEGGCCIFDISIARLGQLSFHNYEHSQWDRVVNSNLGGCAKSWHAIVTK